MVKGFKLKLKKNGQTLKWFYGKYALEKKTGGLTYPGFTGQLNGYSPINDIVKINIKVYMSG